MELENHAVRMCCRVALALMEMWSPFSAKSDYTIGYLTQEPDFDDQKTVLDTVLSSDLREMQPIRDYEYFDGGLPRREPSSS